MSPSHLNILLSTLSLLTTILASSTRYTVPVPPDTIILESRQQLNALASIYPTGTLDDRNGGYYLLDHDGSVLAVTSDHLCEELDASMASARRFYGRNYGIYGNEFQHVVAPDDTCSHPRCQTHAGCRTYTECHVCSSSFNWCY
ncbi:hypothetical protein BDV25DRAFT_19194 [Aspergillus avenaceus]|uniref:Uncharacterized protein n=1 Tax=Aspergillus avenaceus TaxID=36643 RepID=A0A5N6TPW3_ASPAV|nr:hypothetical protein BDV25DRAFT_19194 [Aspergillus avenaceus]